MRVLCQVTVFCFSSLQSFPRHPINYHSTMSVRHAHVFEHKHTWAKRSPAQTPLKGIWTITPPPSSVFRHIPSPSLISVRLPEQGQRGPFADRPVLLLRGKRWTLRCFDRWSLRANFFSQTIHWYGFTPEWERRCRDSSSDRENLLEGTPACG